MIYSDSDAFLTGIVRWHKKGYGIVPLTGAGLSAPSGIPMGHRLNEYLALCIARALCRPLGSGASSGYPPIWYVTKALTAR